MADPTERQYSAWGLVWLLDVCDGLTTSELAEAMGARLNTTYARCRSLEKDGRIEGMQFGFGQQRRVIWYATDHDE